MTKNLLNFVKMKVVSRRISLNFGDDDDLAPKNDLPTNFDTPIYGTVWTNDDVPTNDNVPTSNNSSIKERGEETSNTTVPGNDDIMTEISTLMITMTRMSSRRE